MADITETTVRNFITTELQSGSEIPADKHRAVENKIMDFVVQETAKPAKSKTILLNNWAVNRNYSVTTGLLSNEVIESVQVMLQNKESVMGFAVGDVISAPCPSDSGIGIGVQYNQASNSTIKVLVNDRVPVLTSYNSTPGADVNNQLITGSNTLKWSIKLIIGYK